MSINLNGFNAPIVSPGTDSGEWLEAGSKVGTNLTDTEEALALAFKNGNESEIQQAQVKYNKAVRMSELFNTLIKNIHETFMNLIRRLALN